MPKYEIQDWIQSFIDYVKYRDTNDDPLEKKMARFCKRYKLHKSVGDILLSSARKRGLEG